MNLITNKIKTAIEQYNMINKGEHVIVALSGGADSVVLLCALISLREECGITVSACHVNHNLRGAESNSDEAFVRELCESLGVELNVHSVDVKSQQKKHQSIEETARDVRYEFFAELSGTSGNKVARGNFVATAHTASDNAETVLFNLMRGTGLKGLCGIPPIRGNIIRPLILCERGDIEEYCRLQELCYVTDSSNFCEDYTRNKIRLSILPIIREINPSFDGSITNMCKILREDSDYLEFRARQAAICCDYSAKHLQESEKPLLKRIIIGLLSHNNISPSNLRVSQIVKIIESYKQGGASTSLKVNLEKHKFAVIEDGILKIKTITQFYR